MCGIAGKISLTSRSVNTSDLQNMLTAIEHRGPDSSGLENWGKVGFVHARLAIVDLSAQGHQPMSYHGKKLWITFNGEVYNFPEIRSRLIGKGYHFRSGTDTEVILAAYQEYGEACVSLFRGMFAFAIYDRERQTIFAARDRLGKKPFKYYFDGTCFLFASEIKALLTQPEVQKEPDWLALEKYMYWGFVPAPQTGFRNIFKLPAGSSLTLDLKSGKMRVKKYWKYTPRLQSSLSFDEAKQSLRSLLSEAVKIRLISDVPVGAFLSGGIDSTIIVGIMSQLMSEPVKTFTIGFPGWENDEREAASYVSQLHNTDHTEISLSADIAQDLPTLVKMYDEPFADSSALPSYYVSQATSKHVTVALNGDGGDENFLGYSNYTTFLFGERLRHFSLLFSLVHTIAKQFVPSVVNDSLSTRILRVSHILGTNPLDSYVLYARGYLNYLTFKNLAPGKYQPLADLCKHFPQNTMDTVSKIAYHDLHNVLPDSLMPKVDIASMKFGLEARSPFLDHKVVEYALSLPTAFKYKNGITKYILRETFSDLIPPQIAQLPKRGFVLPLGKWMQHELKGPIQDVLGDRNHPAYQSLLSYSDVMKMLQWHDLGKADYSPHIWKVFMLLSWYSYHIRK